MMKDGVIFINLACGKVVDVKVFWENIFFGKFKGCVVDVFFCEFKSNDEFFEFELMGLLNIIFMFYIGGFMVEVQENIGSFVFNKVIQYINIGSIVGSVNFLNLQLQFVYYVYCLLYIYYNVFKVLVYIDQILVKYNINIFS